MSVHRQVASVLGVVAVSFGAGRAGDHGVPVEVRFADGGTLPVRLRDAKLELTTKYGTLLIPAAEVRRVELATRVPKDATDRIAAAVERLGHPDFRTRTRAEAELKEFRAKALPQLLKAAKRPDPEAASRAEALIQSLRRQMPADDLRVREQDIVHTDDGPLVGHLTAETIRVGTVQFGDQTLRLADVREFQQPGTAAPTPVNAIPAPPTLMEYQGRFGTEVDFTVTGAIPGQGPMMAPPVVVAPGQPVPAIAMQVNTAVWGTDVYTIDSAFAAAAVHAGVMRTGQTARVKVRILLSPPAYQGSARNGVTTMNYNQFPPGAFEFVKP